MTSFHSIPFHSIPFHSIPFHSIPFHSIPFHSIPFHSIPFHSIPFHRCDYQSRWYAARTSLANPSSVTTLQFVACLAFFIRHLLRLGSSTNLRTLNPFSLPLSSIPSPNARLHNHRQTQTLIIFRIYTVTVGLYAFFIGPPPVFPYC